MALRRVWIPSPNYYTGNNGQRLLVIHSSEGAQTYQALGNFFASSSAEASSHVGIDNAVRGTIGEYVKRTDSAWTAANANTVARQAELCTPSGASDNWSRDKWLSQSTMLANLADWLREESADSSIPLKLLTPSQAQGGGRGVCQHRDLGAWGGGHHDCGANFPIDYVMELATGQTPTTTEEEEEEMQLQLDSDNRAALVLSNQQLDGKHFIRLGCRVDVALRFDLRGAGPTQEINLTGGSPAGFTIPSGCKMMIVKVDSGGGSPIAYSIFPN